MLLRARVLVGLVLEPDRLLLVFIGAVVEIVGLLIAPLAERGALVAGAQILGAPVQRVGLLSERVSRLQEATDVLLGIG